MKVLILCGGRGIIDPHTHNRISKAMISIGGKPLVWHVMKSFSIFGYNDFVLALGEGGDAIRSYFIKYKDMTHDIRIDAASGTIEHLNTIQEEDWKITLVDTGHDAHTGSRLSRCQRYLGSEPFFLTYCDCLCNVRIDKLLTFHESSGVILTVTGVQPHTRFGTFYTEAGRVTRYDPHARLTGQGGFINGGFMICQPEIFNYVEVFSESSIEREVFKRLAEEQEVAVFPHTDFWYAVDTERDILYLNELYAQNRRLWLADLT
ncbi:MAG: hypothetical protein NZM04_03155 [Methylacidiphilales bacterium]|nr:hypothetical protein [Candidatus Methylacidiphilales bacterium]MDW8348731.1 glucose-1-phosphate cytidylyltransferase [Verrucomicrobiae bacterium]